MKIEIEISDLKPRKFSLTFTTFKEFDDAVTKIMAWRRRKRSAVLKLLVWMNVPYREISEFEFEVDERDISLEQAERIKKKVKHDFLVFRQNDFKYIKLCKRSP